MPKRAHTVALATPCWPAPVSATMRRLPSRCASSAWPTALLILCAPVCARSSRLSQMRAPPTCCAQPLGEVERRLAADVVARQRGRARPRRTGRRRPSRSAASSSSSAAITVSGTKRPPKRPKRPSASGACWTSRPLRVGAHRASFAAATRRRTRSWSLMPAALSTPLAHVDAVRPHLAHRLRHVVRRRARPPAAAGALGDERLASRQCAYSASMSRVSRPRPVVDAPERRAGRRRRRRRARRGSRARRSARRALAARRRATARGRARSTRPARPCAPGPRRRTRRRAARSPGTTSRTLRACSLRRHARARAARRPRRSCRRPPPPPRRASSARVTPQILTRSRCSPHERREQLGVAHQRRARRAARRRRPRARRAAGRASRCPTRRSAGGPWQPAQQLVWRPRSTSSVVRSRALTPMIGEPSVECALQVGVVVHLDDGLHLEVLRGLDEVGRQVVLDQRRASRGSRRRRGRAPR